MSSNLREGLVIDQRFLLKSKLGEGGMGSVWLAKQLDADNEVSIKILKTEFITAEDCERFLRECRHLSKLPHPHIVTFYHYATSDDGTPYFTCEYVRGSNLRELISSSAPLPVERVLRIATQVADALSFAHGQGIVHRDLKPENILLSQQSDGDWAKVIDFGLSGIICDRLSPEQQLTFTGQIMGTYNYMSPEQCIGEKVGPSADIYALACVIYECLSGKAIFQAETPIATMFRQRNEDAEERLKELKDCPKKLKETLRQMLAKSPEARPKSMADVIVCLERAHDSQAKQRRLPNWVPIGLTGFLLLSCASYFLSQHRTEKQTEKQVEIIASKVAPKEADYKRSIELARKRFDPSKSEPLIAHLEELADYYSAVGKYADAEPVYKEALFLQEKLKPSPELASLRCKLGALYKYLGEYKQAEPLFQQALTDYEREFGKDDLSAAKCLGNLGELKLYQNEYARAEDLIQSSIDIYNRARKSENSSEHSISWGNFELPKAIVSLAVIRRKQNKLPECEQLLKDAFAIRKTMKVPYSDLIANLLDLADVCREEKKNADASSYFQKACDIWVTMPEGSEKSSIRNWLDAYEAQTGQYKPKR